MTQRFCSGVVSVCSIAKVNDVLAHPVGDLGQVGLEQVADHLGVADHPDDGGVADQEHLQQVIQEVVGLPWP